MTEQQILLNDLQINYVEAGSGQPMIFMHNGGGFYHSWEHQLTHYAQKFRVFGLDWPGFGKSQAPEGRITLELLTETLTAFIHEKELKDCILVGNCIGGSAALNYAIRHPETVSHLLIFNICPGDLVVRLPFMRGFLNRLNRKPLRKRAMERVLAFIVMKTPVKKRFPKILFGKSPDKTSPLFQRYERKFALKETMKSRLKLLFAASTYNLSDFLPKDIPDHLLVWGEHNRVTPVETHGKYHRNLLNSDHFEIVKNTGHLCMYEDPEQVIRIIDDYIFREK